MLLDWNNNPDEHVYGVVGRTKGSEVHLCPPASAATNGEEALCFQVLQLVHVRLGVLIIGDFTLKWVRKFCKNRDLNRALIEVSIEEFVDQNVDRC